MSETAVTSEAKTYAHSVRIRYVDCDMQGVVYNAHYLTFVDDGFDCWIRQLGQTFEAELGWEVMLKKAEITWAAPARFAEHLDITMQVSRWGNTSFDIVFTGTVEGRPIFHSTITYVTVDHEHYRPIPIPDALRSHLQ